MPETRLDLIETLEGSGNLLIDGRPTPIRYVVKIFQEMLEADTGRQVPGLKSAVGQLLDLRAPDAAKAIGRTVQLVLHDGRKCDVILMAPSGAFQVSGPIV